MRKPYLLNDVPEDLWEALRNDAASREPLEEFQRKDGSTYPSKRSERGGSSVNNVAAEILAKRYELDFSPTNRHTFVHPSVNRSLYLRLPEQIMDAVASESAQHGSKRATILLALAEHYMLSLPAELETQVRRTKRKHGRPRGRR